MVFGTFDILHPGHFNFFKQAKQHGDYLIAVIARDKTVLGVKGKLPKHNERSRLQAVKNSGAVDKIVLGRLGDKYGIIKQYKPDVIALGYDQANFVDRLENKIKNFKLKTKIIRLKPFKPEKYKSSKLK